jgi:hypothetical protein
VAAVAIGFINIFASLAGYVGNHLLGWMKTRGATDSTCLFFLSSCFLLGGAILGFVKTKKQAVAASTHTD